MAAAELNLRVDATSPNGDGARTQAVCWWLLQLMAGVLVVVPPLLTPHWLGLLLPAPVTLSLIYPALLTLRSAMTTCRKRCRGGARSETPTIQPHKTVEFLAAHAAPMMSQHQPSSRDVIKHVKPVSASIYVVSVERLEAALKAREAREVLLELFAADRVSDLLVGVEANEVAARGGFALVSYRQERLVPDDGTTLDTNALASVVKVAKEAGLYGLWLDGWCYRPPPGPYVHDDFVRSLSAVAGYMKEVVWLPRARRSSPPSYQFRLWCTFEAAVVAERELKVRIAGVGPTLSQRLLMRLGSAMPALPGVPPPAEIRLWCYYNSAVWLCCGICPVFAPFLLLMGTSPKILQQCCPTLGNQCQLALSGQRVLRAMLQDKESREGGLSSLSAALVLPEFVVTPRDDLETPRDDLEGGVATEPKAVATRKARRNRLARKMRAGLPWLPAYDRRDVLAVCAILNALVTEEERTGAAHDRAIAVSIYASAMLTPSPTDATDGHGLRGWLAQKRLQLPTPPRETGLPFQVDEGQSAAVGQLARGRSDRSGRSGRSDRSDRIELSALADMGWSWQRGATWLLFTPVGTIRVPSASDQDELAWDASRWQPVRFPPAVSFVATLDAFLGGLCVGTLALPCAWAAAGQDAAGFRLGVGLLNSCYIGGVVSAAFGSFIPAWLLFTRQFGAAPNIADFAYLFQRTGFRLTGFLFYTANCTTMLLIFVLLLCASAAYESGTPPAFPLGTWTEPDVPPSHYVVARTTVALCVLYSWFMMAPGTNQFYHMWVRNARDSERARAGKGSRSYLVFPPDHTKV